MSLHHVDGHRPPSEHATGFARIDDVEGGRPLSRPPGSSPHQGSILELGR
jgi:hypothetical protein